MVEFYRVISYISFGLAVLFGALSMYFFFKFHIIKVVCDLTGITAKRAIKSIRRENEKKLHDAIQVTDRITNSGRIINSDPSTTTDLLVEEETQLLQPSWQSIITTQQTNQTNNSVSNELENKDIETTKQQSFTIIKNITYIDTERRIEKVRGE